MQNLMAVFTFFVLDRNYTFTLSLRPYGSGDFEIDSCCKHGFFYFFAMSVSVDTALKILK